MARKRIKTLAHEWGASVEDVLAGAKRLRLESVHTESSLISPDEAERLKAELQEEANRTALMRREKIVETTAGRVVEKRLNAVVMRRRHAESEPVPAAETPLPAEEPFHFDVESVNEEPLIAPSLEDIQSFEPQFVELEPQSVESQFPAIQSESSSGTDAREPSAQVRRADGAAEQIVQGAPTPSSHGEAIEAESGISKPVMNDEASSSGGAEPEMNKGSKEARAPESSREQMRTAARQHLVDQGSAGARQSGRSEPPPAPSSPAQPRTINLTRTPAQGRSLDDVQQQGPKVLGKIDLRKPSPRPAAPAPRLGAGAPRPGTPPRPVQFRSPRPGGAEESPPLPVAQPPSDVLKPGARTIKKKRVVKKAAVDTISEREMRAGRFPKKRRALPGKEQKKTEITTPKASKRVVRISEGVTVADLAHNMGVKAAEVIKKLIALGVMSTMNQVLDVDTATLVASEFGYNVENVALDLEAAIEQDTGAIEGEQQPRPPVVTVMGHVDHGKTSLLDAIRHTDVTSGESGGITQHIGAYSVEVHGRVIAFIDTPGHEAFTGMRARGAKVTDIVVLVVAADEGVMPQTVEALNHARAAKVPIVVAVNKIDRPEANIDRVKQQLTEQGLIPEDYGGDTIVVGVSARTGEGIERLLEMILLQADILELKANPDRPARGTVIESQLDRGRGPVATVLIQEGTLHQGDAFVCGSSYGRVRAMLNHLGQKIAEAGPAAPVEIFGLSSVPEPGTLFQAVAEESKARQVAEYRESKQREGELQKTSRVSLEDLSERMKAGEIKELKVVVKGDVQGSVEALSNALKRLSTDEVKLEVIHSSAGAVSENDVTLAAASGAIAIGFNVRPEPKAAVLAEKEGVEIRLYTIIYDAINEMREAMEGLLAPTYREKALGRAEVRQIFNVPGGTVAGSMVTEGKVARSARARLVRDGRVAWEGKIGSLRRFKDDAREVQAGYECGIVLENFGDVKPGDIIETFELETVLRKLAISKPEPMRGQMVMDKQL